MATNITTDGDTIFSGRDNFPGMSDEEAIEALRERLVCARFHDYTQKPVRVIGNKAFFFDANEIYYKVEFMTTRDRTSIYPYSSFNAASGVNSRVWIKAATKFKEGASLRECLVVFLNETIVRRNVIYTEMERIVQRIERPVYEREPGNQNKNTFDRIRCSVCLCSYLTWDELKRYIRKWKQDIVWMVEQRIENDNRFQRFGVPINFLHLSALTLTRDFTLEFVFELKQFEYQN